MHFFFTCAEENIENKEGGRQLHTQELQNIRRLQNSASMIKSRNMRRVEHVKITTEMNMT